MLAHLRLITSGRPKVRRTVVVDSLVEHLTVDFGHNYSRKCVLKLLSFCSGHFSKSRRVFGWSQLNFLGSDRRVQWKQKYSLLSQTHSRCGNTPKLFAFVTMIFAIFQTMSMVSLNKIYTRVLEHEPKAWVVFLLDTRYLHLWEVHCFAPARHAHCRIPCPPDMDCSLSASLRPNILFASATHARALHAHNKLWLLWKTRKGQWARTCATFHAVAKSAGPSFGITCNA